MKYLVLAVFLSASSSALAADCKASLSGLWRTKASSGLDVVVRYKADGDFGALISKGEERPILATGKWTCQDGILVTYVHEIDGAKVPSNDPAMVTRYFVASRKKDSFTATSSGEKHPRVYVRMSGTLEEYYRRTYAP